MRKPTIILTLCIILMASVAGNIYFARERIGLVNAGSFAFSDAVKNLQVAVNMPIQNQPNNTLADRSIEAAVAAAYLTSAAHYLNDRGVEHVEGIAQALDRFSYDLPYPAVFGTTKVNNEWEWTVTTAHQLQAVDTNNGIDLNQLKTVIDSLYNSMPVSSAQRNAYYSSPLQ